MSRPMLSLNLVLILILAGCAGQTPPAPLPSPIQAAPTGTQAPTVTQPASPPLPTFTPTVVQPASSPTTTQVPERQPDWSLAVARKAIVSPITVADGTIYFGSDDASLYAVDAAAKSVKWKFETGGAVRSQPVVGKDFVYISSDDGYVYAISLSNGSQAWKRQVSKIPLARNPIPFYSSAPALSDSSLFVGSRDGLLFALDARTGKVTWRYDLGEPVGIFMTPQVDEGLVLFGDLVGNFYGIDTQTGTQAWILKTGDAFYANGFTLVNHVIYLGTTTGIYALDAKNGNVKWKTDTRGAMETPAYQDGVLYMDYANPVDMVEQPVAAYDATDGKFLRIVFSVPRNNFSITSPVLGKANLYIGLYQGAFYAVDIQSGAIQWKITVKSGNAELGVASTAAIADGMLYFAGMDGVLYAVKDE